MHRRLLLLTQRRWRPGGLLVPAAGQVAERRSAERLQTPHPARAAAVAVLAMTVAVREERSAHQHQQQHLTNEHLESHLGAHLLAHHQTMVPSFRLIEERADVLAKASAFAHAHWQLLRDLDPDPWAVQLA